MKLLSDEVMLNELRQINLLVFLLFFAMNNLHADALVKLMPPKEFSAGPYGFTASIATVNGINLGYVDYGFGVQKFGNNLLTFLACDLSRPSEEMDGICNDWKIYHLKSDKIAPLKLPGFDSFTSIPRFHWPFVAYVDTASPTNTNQRSVFCQVYDFEKQRLVKRIKANVKEDVFATDYPGMFLMPEVVSKRQFLKFSFFVDDGFNQHPPLCEIQITIR